MVEKVSNASHTGYVIVNKLALPLGALVILVAIGLYSSQLLGEYALVTTYFFIMQTIPLLGLTTFVMREVARHPDEASKYFSTIGFLAIVGCVFVNLIVMVFLPYSGYSDEVVKAVQLVGLTIFPGIIVFLAEILLTSLQKTKSIAKIALIENVSRVILSLVALWFYTDIVSLIWVLFITRLAALFFYLIILQKINIQPLKVLPDLQLMRRTLKMVLPFFFNAVLLLVISRMDFIILSLYESAEQIGLYAIGYRFYDISLLLMGAFISAAFPWMAKRFLIKNHNFCVSVKVLFISLIMILWPFTMLGFFAADWYVFLLFNSQYPEPVLLSQLFMVLLAIAGLDLALAAVLHATDQQVQDTRALLIGSVFYCALLLFLIPKWDIYGAVLSLTIAVVIQGAIRLIFVTKSLPNFINLNEFKKLLLALMVTLFYAWLIFDFSAFWQATAIVLFIFVIFPLMLNQLGIFKPLRWIRFFMKSYDNIGDDVTSLPNLMIFLSEDSKQLALFRRKMMKSYATGGFQANNLSYIAVVLYRISRFFLLKGHTRFARLFWQLNLIITKSDIRPDFKIAPGLVLVSTLGIVISANLGRNAIIFPFSGLGKNGNKNIGAGEGYPVVGDDFLANINSGVLGAHRIDSSLELPPNTFVISNKDLSKIILNRKIYDV